MSIEFRNYTEREVIKERVWKETECSYIVTNPHSWKLRLWILICNLSGIVLGMRFRCLGTCVCGKRTMKGNDPDQDDYMFSGSLDILKRDLERIDFFAKRQRERVLSALEGFTKIAVEDNKPQKFLLLDAETEIDHQTALDLEDQDHEEDDDEDQDE